MASSGTITNTFRTGYAVQIVWTVNSQDIANNTSNVTAKVQLVSLGSSYTISSSASKSGSLTINGTKYSFTFTAALSGSQTKTLYTKTVNVSHSADGSKTCSFSCVAGIDVTLSGTYWGDVTASGSGVFNTIPRASSISSVTSSVSVNGTNAVTVSISRASSSFTHTVVFKFGSYSKTTTSVGTSTSYAIPMSWLNAIPNATSGTATVTVTTYNGSTKIGSAVSKTFKLTVPSSVVPSISSVSLSEAVSGIAAQFGAYVQNKSKLAVTITAAGSYSSTIKSYKTVILGKTYTSSSFTSAILSSSGSVSVAVTVTDSRGRTATKTSTVTVTAYHAPTITAFTGYRGTSDGTEDYDGTYLHALLNFTVAAVGNKNTKSYVIDYKLQSATTWTTLVSGSVYSMNEILISASGFLNTEYSYDVRLSVSDFFTTVRSIIEIPTAFTLLDFNASGKGIAFGKVSELSEGIEFALPTTFSNAEIPKDAKAIDSSTDLDDVLTPGYYVFSSASSMLIGNMPIGGAGSGSVMVIREGESTQVRQVVTRCSVAIREIWERLYYSSTWQKWMCVYKGGGRLLWSGGMYMQASHTIALSEKVSSQPNGIVLVFSRYSASTIRDYHFNHFFVHKSFVATHPTSGSQFLMTTDGTFSIMASKYLYIHDDSIEGNDVNIATGTGASGITYENNGFVLRYVFGV